ncbi:hypothetical protein ACFQZJ_15255 [Maribacter chungangensis]|uniref:DUF4249 family protein n=1 Tax=Maribacter chungangensis TaxID=1069117 RepID=A0ABW3B693_9FLAO
MKKYIFYCFLFFASCSEDLVEENSLALYLQNREVVLDNVIACAASNETDDLVSVFLYPRPGASNIQYFEATSDRIDKNNFESYTPLVAPLSDVFNGFLQKFDVAIDQEKWVIVSFEEDGAVHLSNPIRIKNRTKPTEYSTTNITVEQNSSNPLIMWEDGSYDDTRIYFQVVTDADNNLISGTYTLDRFFRFYVLDNVVLNITPGAPTALQSNTPYGVTLLAVSEDNWVNLFAVTGFTP